MEVGYFLDATFEVRMADMHLRAERLAVLAIVRTQRLRIIIHVATIFRPLRERLLCLLILRVNSRDSDGCMRSLLCTFCFVAYKSIIDKEQMVAS